MRTLLMIAMFASACAVDDPTHPSTPATDPVVEPADVIELDEIKTPHTPIDLGGECDDDLDCGDGYCQIDTNTGVTRCSHY